jgi:DNA-directed RNA polymerase specialized sigma24 family protein
MSKRHTEIDASSASSARQAMRALGDAALVEEMRSGDERAFREFIVRFEDQLDRHARRLGYAGAERRTIVAETLDDAAIALIVPGRPTPRSLPVYLVTALRNRIRNERRSIARARVRETRVDRDPERDDDSPLACSEGSLRASAGPLWEPPAPSPAVAGLAAVIVNELTDKELELLVWVSHHVSYREIAAWHGVSYAAIGKRIERLRGRMRARAAAYLATVTGSERAALESLLARGAVPGRLDPLPGALTPVRPVPREGASR